MNVWCEFRYSNELVLIASVVVDRINPENENKNKKELLEIRNVICASLSAFAFALYVCS